MEYVTPELIVCGPIEEIVLGDDFLDGEGSQTKDPAGFLLGLD